MVFCISAYYEWITGKSCLPVPFCIFYLQIVVNLNLISRVYTWKVVGAILIFVSEQDSSVSIVTASDWTVKESRFNPRKEKEKILVFSSVLIDCGAQQPSLSVNAGCSLPGNKVAEAWSWPVTIYGLKNMWNYLPTSRTVLWHGSLLGRLQTALFLLSGPKLHVDLKSNLKCAQRGCVTKKLFNNCIWRSYRGLWCYLKRDD
jgi:hypothetical protein